MRYKKRMKKGRNIEQNMYKFLLDFIYAKKKDLNLTLEYIISLFF